MKVVGVFIAFLSAAILGIASLVIGACGENGAFGGKIEMSKLTKENAEEGLIVEGEVFSVWDKFAVEEKEENGSTTTLAEYYTMIMEYSYNEEAPMFIGISSRDANELSTLEQMRSEVEGIINDTSDSDVYTTIHFRGKLKKLDDGMLGFLKVSVSSLLGVTEDVAEEYITPYVIESYNGSDYMPLLIAGIALTIVGVGGVLVLILKDIGEDN
ncbi:MAG: hypothetical protein J1F28_03275 [Oscillospiraceae bacterium]|nr:hypothetical protein [Oscillospiraceae bacterium]